MSWSIEEHIGDCRPFPAQVVVYKGETGECLAYVSGEVADRLRAENAKLRELVRNLYAEWGFAHRRMRYIVLQHEERMREIEQRMRELGAEVD